MKYRRCLPLTYLAQIANHTYKPLQKKQENPQLLQGPHLLLVKHRQNRILSATRISSFAFTAGRQLLQAHALAKVVAAHWLSRFTTLSVNGAEKLSSLQNAQTNIPEAGDSVRRKLWPAADAICFALTVRQGPYASKGGFSVSRHSGKGCDRYSRFSALSNSAWTQKPQYD